MAEALDLRIGPLKEAEVEEAHRIMRLAFGTFLGLPDPLAFGEDRNFIAPRWRARHCRAIAARLDGRLIGSNIATRWGSFAFLGPLTVLPEFWDKGVAQRLLAATMKIFDQWGVRHTGLFTFAHSTKHVGLYQKFGYWPAYLTAIMKRTPEGTTPAEGAVLLSGLRRAQREEAIAGCTRMTNRMDKGLDLSAEIRTVLAQRTGETLLTTTRGTLDGFAVCATGAGTEGGSAGCYVKFGAARSGKGAGERFSRLLQAVDWFASLRGLEVQAGMNLAREDAFRRMRAHGYLVLAQGVAMHRPHAAGFNRGDVYVMDDWR